MVSVSFKWACAVGRHTILAVVLVGEEYECSLLVLALYSGATVR